MRKVWFKNSIIFLVNLLFIVIILLGFAPFKGKVEPANIIIKSIDPLIKITPDAPTDIVETVQYNYARGEEVHIQLVLWNKNSIRNFSIQNNVSNKGAVKISVQRIGYVSIKEKATNIDNPVKSSTNQYPDPLFDNNGASNIEANSVTSFWISFPVSRSLSPGRYKIQLSCSGNSENKLVKITKTITLIVSNAIIKKVNYPWFSNWIIVDIPSEGPSMKKLKYINDNKDVIAFDNNYWDKVCSVADFMRSTDQNVYMLSPLRLATYTYKGNDLQIDFRRFDSMLNCYSKNKLIGRIDGWQISTRPGSFESNFLVHYVKKDSTGNARFATGQPEDAEVQKFYKAYLPALIIHLKNLNLYNIYYQHIADEPIDANADSYIRIIKMVKSIAPDLKTIEPIQTTKVAQYIDIPIPQLDYLDKHSDYFENLIKQGKEVWMYTALMPQGTYANRFIEQQALQHRLLAWILAKYNLKGMLNWGFNYWDQSDLYNGLGKMSGKNVAPAGDAYLVYPKNNRLISSIRLETMKDGLDDYALLMKLKQKNPRLEQQLVNQVVNNYSTYISDVNAFRKVRATLLSNL